MPDAHSAAVIACGHAVTADAAEAILREGGTAADAAIAAALAAMVCEPVLAGLLGGGFCMLSRGGETKLLDFFCQTPKRKVTGPDLRKVEADFGTTTQAFHIGAGSIAAPCLAAGLAELHDRAGRMPFRELAQPAIEAARKGVLITAYQARLSRIVAPILEASPESRALHCDEKGLLAEGAILKNADFADVLEVFAAEGPRFVAEGEVAAALLGLTDQGGHLTRRDLQAQRPVWRRPLTRQRGRATLSLNPAPSLGGSLVAFSLELIERGARPAAIASAFRATAAARLHTDGDPVALADPALLAEFRKTVARHKAAQRGTTHISVIDRQGMGAALTLSNGEGCGLIVPGTGIMPNNMLGEEDLIPGAGTDDWLSWPTDRRLASMMCPMAIREGDTLTMLGSGGSNRIRSALAQVTLALTDRNARLQDAIDAPRLHVEGDRLDAELEGLAEEDRLALQRDWPEATFWPEISMFFGGVHATRQSPRNAEAAGDPRRAGVARVL